MWGEVRLRHGSLQLIDVQGIAGVAVLGGVPIWQFDGGARGCHALDKFFVFNWLW